MYINLHVISQVFGLQKTFCQGLMCNLLEWTTRKAQCKHIRVKLYIGLLYFHISIVPIIDLKILVTSGDSSFSQGLSIIKLNYSVICPFKQKPNYNSVVDSAGNIRLSSKCLLGSNTLASYLIEQVTHNQALQYKAQT